MRDVQDHVTTSMSVMIVDSIACTPCATISPCCLAMAVLCCEAPQLPLGTPRCRTRGCVESAAATGCSARQAELRGLALLRAASEAAPARHEKAQAPAPDPRAQAGADFEVWVCWADVSRTCDVPPASTPDREVDQSCARSMQRAAQLCPVFRYGPSADRDATQKILVS